MVTRGMANINGDTIDRTADIYWLLQSIGKICPVAVILFVRTIAYHYETAQLKMFYGRIATLIKCMTF